MTMQPPAILALSLLGSAGISFAVVTLAAPKPAESTGASDPGVDARLVAMQQRLDEQARQIESFKKAAPAEAPMRSSVPALGDAQVGAAIAAWLEKHGAEAAPGSIVEAAAKLAKSGKPADASTDAKTLYAELGKAGGDFAKITDLWKKVKESGQIDALVALYEQNAKDNPRSADAHQQLGNAYLQKLFFSGAMGPEAGIWGTKADKAFDQALEVDPTHWGARFQKAISLSNWPDFLGRKKDAIDNFEVLVKQQEASGNTQAHGWNTYLMLGNLYSQQGKDDQAKDLWERGAKAFPDNQLLKDKLVPKK
jgi:tetratricopeptide (TPR) repeat protein